VLTKHAGMQERNLQIKPGEAPFEILALTQSVDLISCQRDKRRKVRPVRDDSIIMSGITPSERVRSFFIVRILKKSFVNSSTFERVMDAAPRDSQGTKIVPW
jgi:hypothetical protein